MLKFIQKYATAVLTLLGVIVGGLITGIVQYNVTKTQIEADSKKYCIQQIDKKEDILRLQSEKFLSSIGNLINYATIKKITSHQDIQNAISPIVTSGFSLSAYAPDELNIVILKIIESAMLASNADDPILQEEAIKSISGSFGKWPSSFKSAIVELENQRKVCE